MEAAGPAGAEGRGRPRNTCSGCRHGCSQRLRSRLQQELAHLAQSLHSCKLLSVHVAVLTGTCCTVQLARRAPVAHG